MATNLTAIRIEASLDTSGYISAAAQKSRADQQMVDSGNKVAASLDATDRRLNQNTDLNKFLQANDEQAARQLDQITLRYNAGLAAAAKNEESLRRLTTTNGGLFAALKQNQIAFLELQAAVIGDWGCSLDTGRVFRNVSTGRNWVQFAFVR